MTKKKQTKDRVVEMLQDCISIREDRHATYGNSFYGGAQKQHGHVMKTFFPEGVKLNTPDDINRYGCFSAMVGKLIRYANNFENGGHEDSVVDIPVYSTMLRELDEEINNG